MMKGEYAPASKGCMGHPWCYFRREDSVHVEATDYENHLSRCTGHAGMHKGSFSMIDHHSFNFGGFSGVTFDE